MSVSANDTDIVITGDTTAYVRAMQEAGTETTRLTQSVGGLGSAIGDLHQQAKQRLTIIDAAATAGITAATASAAKLEQQLSQLEARSKLLGNTVNQTFGSSNQIFQSSVKAVGDLRREFGMASGAATQLLTAMNSMGATGGQAPQMARNYARMSAVTGESISGLATEQNQFIRSMNQGQVDPNVVGRYSSMSAGLSARVGAPATNILGFANRVAPLASTLGMTSPQVMGWSAAFQRAGQDGIAPATAFNKILADINYSRQWGGPEASKYAGYIGVSPEQFRNMDVSDAMMQIFNKIGREGPGAARFLDRQGLDGIRVQNAVMALSRSGDLEGTINQAQRDFNDTSGYEKAAEAALSGLNDETERVAQTFGRLADAVGAQLIPSLTKVTEAFNKTFGVAMNMGAGALEKTPDWLKLGIGTAAGIGGASRLINIATGGSSLLFAGMGAAVPRGAAAYGYREAMTPGGVQNANAEMFRKGEGTLFQQMAYAFGGSVGTFRRTLKEEKNPVKEAEAAESKVTKDTKEKTAQKEKVRAEQEERIKVEEEQRERRSRQAKDTAATAAFMGAASTDKTAEATEAMGEALKNTEKIAEEFAEETSNQASRLGRMWSGTKKASRRVANFAMNTAGDIVEDIGDPVHHKDDYHVRRSQRAMFGPFAGAMYSFGGYGSGREGGVRQGLSDMYFRGRADKYYEGDFDQALRQAADLSGTRDISRIYDYDASLAGTAGRNTARIAKGTLLTGPRAAAQATVAGGSALVSGLGRFAMAHPVGTALFAGSMLAGPVMDQIGKSQERMDALSDVDTSGIMSSSQALREALGLASAAVKGFAADVRDSSPKGGDTESIESALTVSEQDIKNFQNKPGYIDEYYPMLSKLKPGKEEDQERLQWWASSALRGAHTPEEFTGVKAALLGVGLDEEMTEDILSSAWATAQVPSFEDTWKLVGDKNKSLAETGKADFELALDHIHKSQGGQAADAYAMQTLEYLTEQFNTGGMDRREITQALAAFGSVRGGADLGFEWSLDGLGRQLKGETVGSYVSSHIYSDEMGEIRIPLDPEDIIKWMNESGANIKLDPGDLDSEGTIAPILTSNLMVQESLSKLDVETNVGGFLDRIAKSESGAETFVDIERIGDIGGQYALRTGAAGVGGMIQNERRLGRSDDPFGELDAELGELVVQLKNVDPALAEFASAMRAAARDIQQMDMARAGQTGLAHTGGLALRQLQTAYDIQRGNPDSDTAVEELVGAADAAYGEAQKIDSQIRSGWHGFYNQGRNEARGWENFAHSKRIATENRAEEIGWQRSDQARQVGWQEEDFSRSMRYREEDFQRSRRFQEEDFQLYRQRGWENFERQRLREEDNYQRQRGRAEEDYQRQLYRQNRNWNRDRGRQEEDFQRGRLREEEDFNHRIEQMAKQTARAVFDVYSRVGVERTWSVQNLLQNMADQQRYLDEQLKNLAEARRLGLSDQAIEVMGLADSSKAQQLQRIVDDLRSTPSQADAINKAIEERLKSSGELMQDESNSSWTEMMYQRDRALAQQLEDYERGRERSQEDYRLSLAESLEDFRRSLARQDEDREIALAHSNEDFRRSMQEQLEDYERNNARSYAEFQRQTKRTNEEHARSMARSNELFEESLSRSEYLFQRSLDQQADDMRNSYRQSREMLNEQLEFITVTTDDAYSELNSRLQGKTKEQFAEYKKTYDNIVSLVRQVKGAVAETYQDLTLPMPVASGSTGHVDPKVHQQIGGPETGSEKGLAGVLGSSGGGGASGSHNASPARGGLSQGFHAMHQGIDIAGSTGDPIQAARGGVVSFAGDGGAYGRFTKIRHDSGMETWYGHQSIQNVVEGQEVSPGQVIGRMGDTGKSTGPHLHFEVRLNGQPIDPTGWAAGQGMGAGGFGGPDLERTLKRADLKGAFGPWEKGIDKTHFRPKIKRDATAKWWEDKIRQAYEDHYGPEMDTGFYSGPAGLGGVVRPVPQAHSGWNGGRYRSSGKWHGGLDFPAPKGTPIRAMWPGRVIKALRLSTSYGHHAQLDHGGGLSTLYAHMSRLNASVGQNVNAGDILGLVGSTGNSTGNHLHLEVRVNGKQVDPTPYLTGKKTAGKSNVTTVNGKLVDVPTLNLMRKAEGYLGQKYTVTQGVKRPATSYSGSTHTGLGVLDMLPASERGMNALRRVGAASWLRLPWEGPWNSHLHTVFPVAGLAQSAYNQYQNYLRGYNGLGKKDRYPFVPMDDPTIRTRASVGGYAGGTPNAAAGLREVGEHGMEIILGRGLKKFLGGEQVLNPLQTRRAFHSAQGYTPQNASGPAHITYDHSMRVDKVEVVAQNPEEMRNKLQQRQRFGALTGARG